MADIKRLHKIIQEMGSDPNVSMHELVREVLKRDHDFSDYYLDNISKPDTGEELETIQSKRKETIGDIREVQARLDEFLKEDGERVGQSDHDQNETTLETIEQLRIDAKKRADSGR